MHANAGQKKRRHVSVWENGEEERSQEFQTKKEEEILK